VKAGDVLAGWGVAVTLESRITLNTAKMAALQDESRARLADARDVVGKAEESAMSDSSALEAVRELARKGFTPIEHLQKSTERYRRSRALLSRTRRAEVLIRVKYRLALEKLRVEADILSHRVRSDRERGLSRSPVTGTVASIRQDPTGGKAIVSIVIRRF
jgi:hypothetical protein